MGSGVHDSKGKLNKKTQIMFTYTELFGEVLFSFNFTGVRGNLLSESLVFTLGRAKLDLTVFSISQSTNKLVAKHLFLIKVMTLQCLKTTSHEIQ